MDEKWKDIPGYEGLYQVSNYGRVKSLERIIIKKRCTYHQKEKIMKLTLNKNGYCYVTLYGKEKAKTHLVHRLVAETFLDRQNFKCMPNEDRSTINLSKLEVNHKNENILDNNCSNLEFCTNLYNENYGTGKLRAGILHNKAIVQYSKDNKLVCTYKSGIDAEEKTGIDNGSISRCCYGKQKTAGGYSWRFKYGEN